MFNAWFNKVVEVKMGHWSWFSSLYIVCCQKLLRHVDFTNMEMQIFSENAVKSLVHVAESRSLSATLWRNAMFSLWALVVCFTSIPALSNFLVILSLIITIKLSPWLSIFPLSTGHILIMTDQNGVQFQSFSIRYSRDIPIPLLFKSALWLTD